MTWAELHKASETAAMEAEQAFREGNISKATLLYAKAAELEQKREVSALIHPLNNHMGQQAPR